MKKISEKSWFYPTALLLIGGITYGYCLTYLGFYWDDWEVVMFTKLSPALQSGFYAKDRPFPWPSQLTYLLVGSNPIGWHIVALLLRWAGVLLLVYSLSLLWPRYASHLRWLGALLIVYPGFLQQSAAAQYDRHFATFFLFALSLYLMFAAVQQAKWAWILFPLSWLATFIHLFTMEYFVGLELIRPILLWMIVFAVNKKFFRSLSQALIQYVPYFLITAFYFWWRFIIFPQQLASRAADIKFLQGGSLLGSVLTLLTRAFLDLMYSTLQVWTSAISHVEGFSFQSRIVLLAFGLGILLTILFSVFQDVTEKEAEGKSSPTAVFLIGLFAFFLGAIPVWAIGKQITGGGRWDDRFTLAPMLGAGLIVVALLLWFVRSSKQKIVLSFLLVISIATQVLVVNKYRLEWGVQSDYYWQFYWRAPALQSGTALLSLEQPSLSVTEDDAGFAFNVLYHYRTTDGSLPYWFFTDETFMNSNPKPGISISHSIRNLSFQGNTSASVAFMHPTSISCLRMLDSVYADDPLLASGQGDLIPVSNLSRIVSSSTPARPDPNIFGPEPIHGWCYFFEKADLARQLKDWKTVVALYQQANQNGLSPQYGAEYIPFIEAFARTGDWQKAHDLTLDAQKLTPGLETTLCATWSRLNQISSPDANVIQQVKQSLSCTSF
ncbi:MAG TPA: hypothetical protein VLX61_15445 [Anaerolineales bacterium]|nr:hypothetical protein [Anaerolineales bacterium]